MNRVVTESWWDLLQRFGYWQHGKETVECFQRVSMFKGRQFDRSVILLCVRWYKGRRKHLVLLPLLGCTAKPAYTQV